MKLKLFAQSLRKTRIISVLDQAKAEKPCRNSMGESAASVLHRVANEDEVHLEPVDI